MAVHLHNSFPLVENLFQLRTELIREEAYQCLKVHHVRCGTPEGVQHDGRHLRAIFPVIFGRHAVCQLSAKAVPGESVHLHLIVHKGVCNRQVHVDHFVDVILIEQVVIVLRYRLYDKHVKVLRQCFNVALQIFVRRLSADHHDIPSVCLWSLSPESKGIHRREHFTYRPLTHQVAEFDINAVAAGHHDKLDTHQRCHTHPAEVVSDAEVRCPEQFCRYVKQDMLLQVLRLHLLHLRREFWHGQQSTVYLTVRRQRHRVQLHIDRRHHIVRQCLAQELAHRLSQHRRLRGVVQAQHLRRAHRDDLGSHAEHALIKRGLVFYLAHFDAETTQLHLIVYAAEELQFTVTVIAHQIARAVGLERLVSHVQVYKTLCCDVVAVPIALCYLVAREQQFARNALRHKVPVAVADK